jgi:hypothetical protein
MNWCKSGGIYAGTTDFLVLLLLLQVSVQVADLDAVLPAALKPSSCSLQRFLDSSRRCGLFTAAAGREGCVQVRHYLKSDLNVCCGLFKCQLPQQQQAVWPI